MLDGQGKLQWRPDWAMRWAALEVDYEMYGKDLIDSARLSGAICKILGGTPPAGFAYEMFLDEHGQKISKSKGNGLSCDEWLTYGTLESLELFMFQAPRKAKRLYFDVIPRNVDDYFGLLERYPEQSAEQRYHNPVWHLHDGQPPEVSLPVNFGLLLNLASVVNAESAGVLWEFIARYAPDATPANTPQLGALVDCALNYYRDFVKPAKSYRLPDAQEKTGARGAARLARGQPAGPAARGADDPAGGGGDNSAGGLRDRQAPWLCRQPARLVPGALRDPARPERGAALRLLRGLLWPARDRGADRPGPRRPADRPAGGVTEPPMAAAISARRVALDVLDLVLGECRPLDEVFAGHPALARLSARDRAHARLLVATTLRRLGQIDAVLDAFLRLGRSRSAS